MIFFINFSSFFPSLLPLPPSLPPSLSPSLSSVVGKPKLVEEFEGHKIVAIASGDEFSLAVDEKGLPWVWGKGDKGQVRLVGVVYRIWKGNRNG